MGNQLRLRLPTWTPPSSFRFNKSQEGRGAAVFGPRHMQQLETLLFRHYGLLAYRDDLMPQAG
jgi:hypothetical protein